MRGTKQDLGAGTGVSRGGGDEFGVGEGCLTQRHKEGGLSSFVTPDSIRGPCNVGLIRDCCTGHRNSITTAMLKRYSNRGLFTSKAFKGRGF